MHALLRFKDPKNLDNTANPVKLELLKLNFKNKKCLVADKVSVIIVKFYVVLDTYLYLTTNCDAKFRELFIFQVVILYSYLY